jgi:phospholipase/lecithinase/hemolysin
LYDVGARDVLVMDWPDLGLQPAAHAPELPPEVAIGLTALTQAHNAALESALNALEQRHPS